MDIPEHTEVRPASLLGSEPIRGAGSATVLDFWRFAMSELRMNNVRGYFGEFLVARAVGAALPRTEWDPFDVLATDGTRIEVKTSGYLQVWGNGEPSKIQFKGLLSRVGDGIHYTEVPAHNADVYVFCVQTAQTVAAYDPLDVDQWDFYVLTRKQIEQYGYKSISLRPIQQRTTVVKFDSLATAIRRAAIG